MWKMGGVGSTSGTILADHPNPAPLVSKPTACKQSAPSRGPSAILYVSCLERRFTPLEVVSTVQGQSGRGRGDSRSSGHVGCPFIDDGGFLEDTRQ